MQSVSRSASLFGLALLSFQISYAQTGALSIVNGKIDFGGAAHTRPAIVVANVGALPATGCTPGEQAYVTAATLGQQNYQNSGTGACVWTQQLNTGSSNGGGITVYSAASLSLTGTQYIPIGGGGLPSSTETNVDTASPSAATVTNFDVQMSAAPGMGNSIVFTWRKNAASQSLTCTISGAVSTGCSDTTHSFNVSQGDLLTIQLVTTGIIAGTPNLVTSVQFGTTGSNGTVNTGTINQTAFYAAAGTAVNGVGPGTSGQIYTSKGSGSAPSFIDFPDVKMIPAANCNNVTAGSGWSIGSGGTVTCRAGTNNLGGYVSITDTASTFATFQIAIPEDWDTSANPYIRFQLASTDATNGHTIIPSIQVACYKGDGSTTDDVAANAAHSLSTVTLNGNANRFWSTANVQMNSTDVTGCVAGALMQITVGRATDTATNAEFYGATVTIPRLLVVQAN